MSDQTEIPLTGGNVNERVVRIGDTVRRAQNKHSENVHLLLQHLEAAGYSHSPRFLGIDDKGREILSFIAGCTEFPANLWSDFKVPVVAAQMLRAFHDATVGLDLQPDGWAYAYPDPARREVICHNDFAPYNMVFQDGLPVAIIDFDLAGPGPRLRDLAYLSYWLAPLSFSNGDMHDVSKTEITNGCPRLKSLCSAYGTADFDKLLDMVAEVLAHMASYEAARQMIGVTAAQRLADGGHFDHWQRESEAFDLNRSHVLATIKTN